LLVKNDLLGKVAMCSQGKVGIITGQKALPWGLSYIGIALDGTDWASRQPRILASTVKEYLYGG
jgi:hypothetical protein